MQQIVYTRCKPRRELIDGRVVNEEEYGIHNFSEGITSLGMIRDPRFVEKRIQRKNAAQEGGANATGVFFSYEYFYDGNGCSMLGQEYLRPYQAWSVRPNGQKHRPGNYIKQYLVGEFTDYPCLLFGADCWDAAARDENSYYHDHDEPLEFLPEIDPRYGIGNISQENIRAFISDGRKECVKQLIAAVIAEMSKPMDRRKFIVIKDFPENVEKWIAAVEFAMPVYLAKQISFNTNVVTANLSDGNTFYCDGGGAKRYHFMIVGIHPADSGSSYFISEENRAAFWVLDGETGTFPGAEAFSSSSAYFDAAVEMDKEIFAFNAFLSELLPVRFGNGIRDLYELFDVHQYLTDDASISEKWNYVKIRRMLSVFGKYGAASYASGWKLAEKVYTVYAGLYEDDEKDGLGILKQIVFMDYADALKSIVEGYLQEKYLLTIKTEDMDIDRVNQLGRIYAGVYPSMEKLLENGLKQNLSELVKYAEAWNSVQSYDMFCKLYDVFWADSSKKADGHKNSELVEILFNNIRKDYDRSADMLAYVANSPLYIDLAIKGVKRDADGTWTEIICKTMADTDLKIICDALLQDREISLSQYEDFLIRLLVADKEREILFQCLRNAVERFGLNVSGKFVREYLRIFEGNIGELEQLVSVVAENDMGNVSEELVYRKVKDLIDTMPINEAARSLAKEFEKLRVKLKKPAGRSYCILLSSELQRAADIETAVDVLKRYADMAGRRRMNHEVKAREDVRMIIAAAGDKVQNDEVLIRLYHIIKGQDCEAGAMLLSVNSEDTRKIMRYIKLIYGSNEEAWGESLQDDILDMGADFDKELKRCHGDEICKIKKAVLRISGKKDSLYNEYFERIQREMEPPIKETKPDEEAVKKIGKETKEILKDSEVSAEIASEKKQITLEDSGDKKKKMGLFRKWFSRSDE